MTQSLGQPCEFYLVGVAEAVRHLLFPGAEDAADSALEGMVEDQVCHYMIQPLVELYGGCMVVLKVS